MCNSSELGRVRTSFNRFFSPGIVQFATRCTLMASAAVAISGCGKPSETQSVHGSVSYKGEPIESGSVTFFPLNGRPIMAALSGEGEYDVELPPGEYVVAISAGGQLPLGFKEGDPPPPPPKVILPPEYSTQAKSTLKATVAPDQSEPIDFKLD